MLWIKAFHVVFVVTWFAGLFYLPRLFVYHCEAESEAERRRFVTMERRLGRITDIGGGLAIGFGLWLLALQPGLLAAGWMHAKLALVALLVAFHVWLRLETAKLARGGALRPARFYRIVNELPALVLIGAVCLVIVRPF